MRYLFIFPFLLLVTGCSIGRYTADVHGTVYNKAGEPFADCIVHCTPSQGPVSVVRTDSVGRFHFPHLVPGYYNIIAEKSGFERAILGCINLRRAHITEVELSIVTPTPEGTHVQRRAPRCLTPYSYEPKRYPKLMNFARTQSDGVVTPDGAVSHIRGSRRGPLLMVDGMRMEEWPSESYSNVESWWNLTGFLPAKFGDSTDGVIVIETKNFFDLYWRNQYEVRH